MKNYKWLRGKKKQNKQSIETWKAQIDDNCCITVSDISNVATEMILIFTSHSYHMDHFKLKIF